MPSPGFQEFLDRWDVSVADLLTMETLQARLRQVLKGGAYSNLQLQEATNWLREQQAELDRVGLRADRRTRPLGGISGFFTHIVERATGRIVTFGDWPFLRRNLNERYGLFLPEDEYERDDFTRWGEG